MPKVSVIVPIYNSPQIAATLQALQSQTIDPAEFEIVVVGLDEDGYLPAALAGNRASGQKPSPTGIDGGDLSMRFVEGNPPYSPAQNRNLGMQSTAGELLCFTDADCLPSPEWLTTLLACYEDPAVNVVGGGVTFVDETYWGTCDNLSWFSAFLATTAAGERLHLPTLNFSLRRSVVEAVGGIDEGYPLPAGEDTEWTARMRGRGYPLHFEPRAVVEHAPQRTTLAALWRHGYNFGRYSPKLTSGKDSAGKDSAGKDGGAVSSSSEWLLPRRPWLLALLSPLLALAATGRVIVQQRPLTWRLLMTVPGIWISKFAWCMGAVRSLSERAASGNSIQSSGPTGDR